MNRRVIYNAAPGGCDDCGDVRMVRVDIADFGIAGVFPCPVCGDPEPYRRFIADFADYLRRPKAPPEVIA
jgi:hypothetical protein